MAKVISTLLPPPTYFRRFFIALMTTLFERINYHLSATNKAEVSDEQRQEIGKKIIARFIETKPPNFKVHHLEITNEKGSFRVAHYPNFFVPVIDAIIRQELQLHPEKPPPPVEEPKPIPPPIEKRIRKRIPAKIQY